MTDKPCKDSSPSKKTPQQSRQNVEASEAPEAGQSQSLRPPNLAGEQLLDTFAQVNRMVRAETDATSLCAKFLDLCLQIFVCDQAWLLFQADIQNAHWNLGFFRSANPQARPVPAGRARLSPELSGFFQAAFALSQPTSFTSGNHRPIPEKLVERFGCRNILLLPLTPEAGSPCLLALNQCSRARIWHSDETGLFSELGQRFADGLSRLNVQQEQLAKEAQLRGLLQSTLDAMPSALIGVDLQQQVNQWNHSAEKLFGITTQTALGKFLPELLPEFPIDQELLEQTLRSRITCQPRRVDWQRQGQFLQLEISLYPISGRNTAGAMLRIDDVSARLQVEEVFNQQEKMFSVGNLAAGIAHEINNPLGAILQNLQVLRNRLNTNLPKNIELAKACDTSIDNLHSYMIERGIHGILDSTISSGQRAAEIIQNMLTFGGKHDDSFQLQDLSILLDKSVELAASSYNLEGSYDFRKIELVRDYADPLPAVQCNPVQMQQVFLNLLNNGAHAMTHRLQFWEKNQATLPQTERPRFILRLKEKPNSLVFEIEDNGCGMSEEVARRVFEPFYTTKKIGEGTGLGMSICYFIITKNHNGKMKLETTPKVGSRFIIELPKSNE